MIFFFFSTVPLGSCLIGIGVAARTLQAVGYFLQTPNRARCLPKQRRLKTSTRPCQTRQGRIISQQMTDRKGKGKQRVRVTQDTDLLIAPSHSGFSFCSNCNFPAISWGQQHTQDLYREPEEITQVGTAQKGILNTRQAQKVRGKLRSRSYQGRYY